MVGAAQGHLVDLVRDGLGDLGVGVPKIHHGELSYKVNVLLAVDICDDVAISRLYSNLVSTR